MVSTAIPAFYSFTGGMRASLVTDVDQVGVTCGTDTSDSVLPKAKQRLDNT